MGSNGSRRQSAMDEDADESDDGISSYAATLSQIISSTQVHIVSPNDGLDSDDSEDEMGHNRALQSKPIGEYTPDTSKIDVSEFKRELCLNTPRLVKGQFDSLPSVLSKRQLGRCGHRAFSPGDKNYLTSNFIPNHVSKIKLHNIKAFCGTFSHDGSVFMSSTQDHIIRLYDTSRGSFRLYKSIYARDVGWSVLDTSFSPNGKNFAYSSWSKYIHLCNIYGNADIHQVLPLNPEQDSFCVFSLAFSCDSREIMAGASDGNIYIYDLYANTCSMKIDAHDDDISSVVFADDTSQLVYSGGDDAVIKVWDRRTLSEEDPRPVGMLAGHSDGVTFIDSKGDARYLISNSKDQTIKLWDIRMFSSLKGIESSRKAVSGQNWDYRWQPVPRRLLRRVKKCDGDSSLMTYKGHCVLHTLIRARFSPPTTGQNFIYCGCASGDVLVYNILTGKVISRLRGHRHCVRDVSWHPFRNVIVSSSWDGSLGIWRYETDEADTQGEDEDWRPPRRSGRLRLQDRLFST